MVKIFKSIFNQSKAWFDNSWQRCHFSLSLLKSLSIQAKELDLQSRGISLVEKVGEGTYSSVYRGKTIHEVTSTFNLKSDLELG